MERSKSWFMGINNDGITVTGRTPANSGPACFYRPRPRQSTSFLCHAFKLGYTFRRMQTVLPAAGVIQLVRTFTLKVFLRLSSQKNPRNFDQVLCCFCCCFDSPLSLSTALSRISDGIGTWNCGFMVSFILRHPKIHTIWWSDLTQQHRQQQQKRNIFGSICSRMRSGYYKKIQTNWNYWMVDGWMSRTEGNNNNVLGNHWTSFRSSEM